MAVITKGNTFANGDQVTAGSLNNLVDNAAFASGAVDNVSTQLSGGAVIVKDGGVSNAKIADDSVTTTKIADAQIVTAKIADAQITTAKIANSNVTTAKIANSNVTTAKIADSNITTAKIADSNVTTAKIADDAVSTAKLPDSAVTTAKINDGAVTTAKITDSAVTTAKLADSNVTTSKIANGNVTKAKIENVANMKVLGNTSGSATAPQEVSILDDDTMSSNSATALATQQSIKAYVDNSVPSSPSVASFTKASGSLMGTALITGYSESDPDGIASESSGTITVTGAGTYLVNFGGIFDEQGSGSFDLQYRVNGGSVMNRTQTTNFQQTITYCISKVSSGTFTVDIRGIESGVGNLLFTDVRIDIIKIA